jgi:hypothetical protein
LTQSPLTKAQPKFAMAAQSRASIAAYRRPNRRG